MTLYHNQGMAPPLRGHRVSLQKMFACFVVLFMTSWYRAHYHWTTLRLSVLELQSTLSGFERRHAMKITAVKGKLLQYEEELASWKSRYRTLELHSMEQLLKAANELNLSEGAAKSSTNSMEGVSRQGGTKEPSQIGNQYAPKTAEVLKRGAFLALGACSAGEAQLCRNAVEFPTQPAKESRDGKVSFINASLRFTLVEALEQTVDGTRGALREARHTFTPRPDNHTLQRCASQFNKPPPLSAQLRAFAEHVWALGSERRIAYSVVDYHYRRGVADVALNYKSACDVTSFLCVALDLETAVHACALGLDAVLYTANKAEIEGIVKKRQVYGAKYGVLATLLDLGLDVTFGEMDVWLLGDPIVGTPVRDITIGVHQDNPYNINAGWIHVRWPRRLTLPFDSPWTLCWDCLASNVRRQGTQTQRRLVSSSI